MSRLSSCLALAALAACDNTHPLAKLSLFQDNLVSDVPDTAAITDPGLVNAWGIAVESGDTVFIAANGTGQVSVYDGDLRIPPGFPLATPMGAPITGIAINTTTGFSITGDLGTAPADLVTASEDGKVFASSARAASAPMLVADLSATGSVFKGVAIINSKLGPRVLLADFANGQIVQLDPGFKPEAAATTFTDPSVPANFGPFGIQQLGSLVYVTYAAHGDGLDEAHGPGLGLVDAYSLDGALVTRVATGRELDAPWGLALAPPSFVDLGGSLLVANFGDGTIHAYTPDGGALLGALVDDRGAEISIPGLWGLAASSDRDDTLFFTAGPDDEAHGLFGTVTAE